MTLDEIRQQLRAKKLTQTEALKALESHMQTKKTAKAAQSVIDEVLGMSSEPAPMSTSEREAAQRWEKGYRGDDK